MARWRGPLPFALGVLLLGGCVVDGRSGDPAASDAAALGAVAPGQVDAAAVQSVEQFWSARLPELYDRPYRRLDQERIVGFTRGQWGLLTCGGEALAYGDVAGNAFAAPCPEGITVAWDAAE